jgi:hypothetical protein
MGCGCMTTCWENKAEGCNYWLHVVLGKRAITKVSICSLTDQPWATYGGHDRRISRLFLGKFVGFLSSDRLPHERTQRGLQCSSLLHNVCRFGRIEHTRVSFSRESFSLHDSWGLFISTSLTFKISQSALQLWSPIFAANFFATFWLKKSNCWLLVDSI